MKHLDNDKVRPLMKKILLAGLLISLVSCGLFNPGPGTVAKKFWSAMQSGEFEKARELITPDSMHAFSEIKSEDIRIDSFELGEVLEGENNSYVMVTLVSPDFNQSFKTALKKVNDQWKVDFKETSAELTRAQIREMGDSFRQGIENAGQELAEQLKGAAEAMKQGMQEMEKAIDESLKNKPDKAGKSEPQNQPF